jgi:hypothetical protein
LKSFELLDGKHCEKIYFELIELYNERLWVLDEILEHKADKNVDDTSDEDEAFWGGGLCPTAPPLFGVSNLSPLRERGRTLKLSLFWFTTT